MNLPCRVGTSNPNAKLTEAQVKEIRRRHAAGDGLRTLAVAYDVSYSLVSQITRGAVWSHLKERS